MVSNCQRVARTAAASHTSRKYRTSAHVFQSKHKTWNVVLQSIVSELPAVGLCHKTSTKRGRSVHCSEKAGGALTRPWASLAACRDSVPDQTECIRLGHPAGGDCHPAMMRAYSRALPLSPMLNLDVARLLLIAALTLTGCATRRPDFLARVQQDCLAGDQWACGLINSLQDRRPE